MQAYARHYGEDEARWGWLVCSTTSTMSGIHRLKNIRAKAQRSSSPWLSRGYPLRHFVSCTISVSSARAVWIKPFWRWMNWWASSPL